MNIIDKYSQKQIGNIQFHTNDEIDIIINNAVARFEQYKNSSHDDRSKWLNIIEKVLVQHKSELSVLICQEAGKPLFYAENEIDRCIRTTQLGLRYFDKLENKSIQVDFTNAPHQSAIVKRFPVGVIFGIAPFNFPINLALHKIIPAIASGNCIIIKPSPFTPLSLQFLIDRINIHLPQGLIQIIHCENDQAEHIVKDQRIKMVSFTGSAQVGWHIKSLIPKNKVALELGGNAAVYIDLEENLEEIATKVAQGAYLFAGQICISTQRIFVHQDCYDYFKTLLIEAIENISSGNPMDNVFNGPLIDAHHLHRIDDWVNASVTQGAKILAGGYILDEDKNCYAPTLIEGAKKGMLVFDEEVFGPLATINKVKNYREAITQINVSKYGLQVGVFTSDKTIVSNFFNDIEAGGVIVNNVPGFRKDEMPYGGIKDSGFGREGVEYAIEEMTELKLLIE